MKFKSALPVIVTLVSVVCLAGAVTYNSSQMKSPGEKSKPEMPAQMKSELRASNAPSVVVLEVEADTYKALVKGYGEVVPHYAIDYSAEVSGRVDQITDKFETGNIVKKGDILVKLENTTYQQAVTEAKSDLAQAELDLLEEQRTGEQARLDWQRSGMTGEPSSPLVLREPQLAAQLAVVENAKYSLKKAQSDLDKTVIKAPFDALIVEQNIQPGSYLQTGDAVAQLYSIDRVEVAIPLSAKQWENLPKVNNSMLSDKNATTWPVTLFSTDGDRSWQGYVTRVEQHLDSTSRQRSLIVAVNQPFDIEVGLFPGTFVQAHIEGKTLDNTWELPASAISQQGDIWFITEDNQLNKVVANKLFEKSDAVYVAPIENQNSVKIIKRPLSSYVVGMLVAPKVEG
ncbi:efflux RND transporter periplasmic adaptor subunit [Psychromonas sp. KJ10-10]|uniref:efflux RND transporter periplasmic adaptor subunit n=1 Tax=Psychromonas sp. KJ10-10 TaxID=3391823 RepID=UPI0039B5153F